MARLALRTPRLIHAATPMSRSTWCSVPVGGRAVFVRVEPGRFDGRVTCRRCYRHMTHKPGVAHVEPEIAAPKVVEVAADAVPVWRPVLHPLDRARYGERVWQCKLAPEGQASVGLYRGAYGNSYSVVFDETSTGLVGRSLTVPDKASAGRAIGDVILAFLEKEGTL